MDSEQESNQEQVDMTESAGDQETATSPQNSSSPSGDPPVSRSPLGLKERKQLNRYLKQSGVGEAELPEFLRDDVTKRSRKGKAGQIVVRRLSGIQSSPATALAQKLENDLSPGREDLIEKLQAGGGNTYVQRVAGLLQANPQFSLARCVAEAGADVVHVLDTYAKGALALKKLETVLGLYEAMPHLMRDLLRHAIDRESTCEVCFGLGKVQTRAGSKNLGRPCPRCAGSGKGWLSSDHKALAVNKILEISQLKPEKGPMVQVNQAVQVNQSGNSELMARISKAADEILYRPGGGNEASLGAQAPTDSDVVDAELLSRSEEY